MRLVYGFILSILTNLVIAQNLVPNPSFETYTTCPTNYGQINYASGWDYIQAAQSAEYFNICSTSSNVSVPNFFLVQITNYQETEMDMLGCKHLDRMIIYAAIFIPS